MNCNLYDVTVVAEHETSPELLAAILNSTLVGLTKIYFGRYAGTEGNLKTEVVDVNLLEIPDPRHIPKSIGEKLRDAFRRLCTRTTGGMVEEAFVECRSPERAKKLAENPIELPAELRQPDRRALDLAVFELLGVSDAGEREKLVDELYWETANHFRQIRIVEIQKQKQRTNSEGREFRTDELAADVWDSLPAGDKQPLAAWLASQVDDGLAVHIPESDGCSLPEANDFLDARSVFFHLPGAAKKQAQKLELPSRAHAELVHFAWQQKMPGQVTLPKSEKAARELHAGATARLKVLEAKAGELARSRTSDERRAMDLSRLLLHWLINGKPKREAQPQQ